MQIKTLLVASLATLGSAAVVERQAPTDFPTNIDEILDSAPTEISGILNGEGFDEILSQASAFAPLITALPSELISDIVAAQATLRPEDYPAFYSSILGQLPPELVASLSDLAGSFPTATGAAPTAEATDAPTDATDAPSETSGDEEPSETAAEETATQTETDAAPTGTNAASRSSVGAGIVGIAGVLGLVFAL